MCPVRPDDIVERPFRGVTWLVQSRIMISRTFQKELSNLAMGRFISFAGNRLANADLIDKMYEGLLKAYTYFVGLSFILNYAGQWIYRDPLLKAYFEQFEMTKEYFKLRDAQGWKQYQSGDWSFYRDWILSHLGYDKSLYDKFNPRESLAAVERYKCARVQEFTKDDSLSPLQKCQLMGAACKDASAPGNFFYVQPEGVPLASVFIGLDVTILFSNIYLMEVYRKLVTNGLKNGHIPAWLASQSARISDSSGELSKIYFDPKGGLKLTIPYVYDNVRHVTFNTYSLKALLDLSLLHLTHVTTETWDLVISVPPDYSYLFIEPWSWEYSPPPEYSMYSLERWSLESSEPPAFTLVAIEPWGIPEPSFTLRVFEPWGIAPPGMTQRVLEHWSS